MKRIIAFLLVFLVVAGGIVFAQGKKNILSFCDNQDVGIIDPHRGNDAVALIAIINMYDTLVFPALSGNMEPKLAKSWVISPDGLKYTFKIKEGVKFHDGNILTAEDIAFSMNRSLALKEGMSWLWLDVVKEATADDTNTVSFHLSKPFVPFLPSLAWLFIANKDLILGHKKSGDFGELGDYGAQWLSETIEADAGSGPFKLKGWDRGREIVFERFSNYFEGWPHGNNSIDEAHILIIRDNATVRTMVRKDEMTITHEYLTYSDYEEMGRFPNAQVISFMSPNVFSFKINTQKMPTDDIHIRKMLAWAMDYKSVIEILEPGSGKARGPIPDVIPGQNPEIFQYYMDLDKAREEMKQSKYYPKIPPIELVTPAGNETRRKIALLFQENLAKLGVTLNIRQEPWGRIVDLAKTPESTPNITGISVGSYYPDPDAYLYSMYHSKSAGSWASTEWLKDIVVDKLLDQERGTLDAKKRTSILNELQRIIVDKCPDVFVYVEPLRVGVQKYLKGFTPRPVSNYYLYFHDWWFEKK